MRKIAGNMAMICDLTSFFSQILFKTSFCFIFTEVINLRYRYELYKVFPENGDKLKRMIDLVKLNNFY